MGRGSRRRDEEEEEELEDEDFDAEEDDDEEEGGRGKKRKGSEFIDDVAEDEDDEEEEEQQRKKSRGGASIFIDDIASDDDDEAEDEIDDGEDIIANEDEDLGEDLNEPDYGHRQYRQMAGEEEEDPEEMVRRFEERYKRSAEDHEDLDANAVTQQGLLPTINDPKLWIVHCRRGREREACMQLLQKAYTMAERDQPLLIKSAFCLDHLQEVIYVEAEKESYVLDAIRGLRTMYVSKGVRLVPLNEMVDAISPNVKAKAEMGRDSWVRVKNGPYKDDLAKVVQVDYAAGKAGENCAAPGLCPNERR